MRIHSLKLKNFRNYTKAVFHFDDGLNVLYGKNAQGKTNCAEAVFYLCTGISPRQCKDRQMIQFGEEIALIEAEVSTVYGNVNILANITETGRELYINGNKIRRNVDLLGNLNGVFFSPKELRLVQDGPEERRRFLNLSISQISKSYYTALMRYNKILEQRNALLKSRDTTLIYDTLSVWDMQLASFAKEIVQKREEYIQALLPLARERQYLLTDGGEELHLELECKGYNKQNIATLHEVFAANMEKDIRLGYTSIGPHRDDLKITVNGEDARVYASQGQTRTIALALKLAEVYVFEALVGEKPILVLDDVLSELDLSRRRKLIAQLDDLQVILTCTHAEKVLFGKKIHKIKIVNGQIKEEKIKLQ